MHAQYDKEWDYLLHESIFDNREEQFFNFLNLYTR